MKKTQIINLIVLLFIFTSCKENLYEKGKINYEKGDYENALINLKAVKEKDKYYLKAKKLIQKSDSLIEVELYEKFINDSLQQINDSLQQIKNYLIVIKEKARLDSIKKVEEKNAIQNEILRLKKELAGIKSFKGGEFRGAISSLEVEVARFVLWGRMADKAKENENRTIKQLGKNIEYHLKKLQLSEFPKIRSEYGKIVKNKLWEHDIDVKVFGRRKTTLQFTGGIFASNRNIKDYQTTLNEILHNLRFKRIKYKWYENDDATYYTLETDSDSKILLY